MKEKQQQLFKAPTYKPILKWTGGKTVIANILLKAVENPFEKEKINYYEPFFGGGALFFMLATEGRIESAVINDTIPHLVSFYETIQNKENIEAIYDEIFSFEEEFNKLNTYGERKNLYKDWRDEFNYLWLDAVNLGVKGKEFKEVPKEDKEAISGTREPNEDERVRSASLFLALNKVGYRGMFRLSDQGKFNIPYGNKEEIKIAHKSSLESTSQALQGVEINCGSYEEVLPPNKEIDPKTSFIYLDPPYIPNSESASFTDYSKEGFEEEEHIKLAEVFQGLVDGGYKVLLSNNNNKEAIEKYVKGTKNTFAYEVMVARNIAPTQEKKEGDGTRPKVSEIIVSSFNLDNLGLSRIE